MKLLSVLSSAFILLVITTFVLLGKVNGAPVPPGNNSSRFNGDTGTFSFASIGDSQAEAGNFANTVNQIATMHPDFVIFNGDLEDNGFLTSETDPMIADLKSAGIFDNTFLIRGNHDDKVNNSASLWESYFETAPNIKTLPAGVSNYVAINSSSTYLTYSYNFGNSIFIGLDVPGDVQLVTDAEMNFLNARLTYAEVIGLTHAFIYFHGPLYCVESTHCDCSARDDGSCTPDELVSVLNAHPIVSATFHGHEHILGWTHMDSSRVPSLTGSFEQFLTSPSGGSSYNNYVYPDRLGYYYPDMDNSQGFGYVTVSGSSFTVSFYKTGSTSPVWTHVFSKGQATSTPTGTLQSSTPTLSPTETRTSTSTATFTRTPSRTSTGTPTSTNTYTPTNTSDPSNMTLLVYPYLGNTSPSSVAIGWATDQLGSAELYYSQDQSYANVAIAAYALHDGRYWYSTAISGLTANTAYHYKIFVNGIDLTPRPAVTFTTAPNASGTSYSFAIVGNDQPASASAPPYPAAISIANWIQLQNPNLVLHTGDMIFDSAICSGDASPWSQYVRNYFNVYRSILGSVPFFPTIGEHEVKDDAGCGYDAYKSIFAVPANAPSYDSEQYYSFDWGNAHFIVLNSNQYTGADGTEYPWLVSDLQSTTKPWKFVFLHVPAYSSGSNGGDILVDQYLVPLFETSGVDLVFSSHDLDYERSCPIKNGACTTVQNGGVVYYVNGGGGAPTSLPVGSWFTAFKSDNNEFLDVTMNDCQVNLNAIDTTGSTFDTYQINRCPEPTPTSTPTQTGTSTSTPTFTATDSPTFTYTPTVTSTSTPTATNTYTATATHTSTPSKTQTNTGTPTYTPTITNTHTQTLTFTPTFTITFTPTNSLTSTISPTKTPTFTFTPTYTLAASATNTYTATTTYTLTATNSATPTLTPTFTITFTPTNSLTSTISPTKTPTFTFTPTYTHTASATNTYTATTTYTLTATSSATPTLTPTYTPTQTRTSTPTLTPTPIMHYFIYLPLLTQGTGSQAVASYPLVHQIIPGQRILLAR